MAGFRASGKGGGLIIQLLPTSNTIYLPLSSVRVGQDPRLGEDTESDDLGSHFSPSGAMVPTAEMTLHRRDEDFPEFIGLLPGVEIWRVWIVLGAILRVVGGTPKQRGHLIHRTTVGAMSDDIAEIAPNLPLTIPLQGGVMWRHVGLPALGVVVPVTPVLPNIS